MREPQSGLIYLCEPTLPGNCFLGFGVLTVRAPVADYSGPSKLPGSATHVLDPRLNLLATLIPGLFAAKSVLDIGCNAGSVSCQVGKSRQDTPARPASDYHSCELILMGPQPSTSMLLPFMASTSTQSWLPKPRSSWHCVLPVLDRLQRSRTV